MRLRVRGPSGVSTISLAPTDTVAKLLDTIASTTGVVSFDVKYGYPPQLLEFAQYGPDTALSELDVNLDGEQLIVMPNKPAKPAAAPPKPAPTPAEGPLSLTRKPAALDTEPPELAWPSHAGTLVLRVMPDDNSCLFRAVGTAVVGTPGEDSAAQLRAVVASGIRAQPELYTGAVLGQAPAEYCAWIGRPASWGGAIELGILAQSFSVEICSINVQDLRVDRFNEGARMRVILVYSGIHYDTIALNPSDPPHTKADAPMEVDVKVFESVDEEALEKARELCRVLQQKHYYTDTTRFDIKCQICGWRGNGEQGASEHAMATGHMDFGEAGA